MEDQEFPRRKRWPIVLIWPMLFIWAVVFVIFAAFGAPLTTASAPAAAAAGAMLAVLLSSATRLCDGMVGATPAEPQRHAVLFNLAESLCLTHGLNVPKLMVMEDSSPTVLSYGLEGRICVSQGFFTHLSVVEQEAVVAHALCRIQRGHARSDTLAAVVFGFVLAPLGMRGLAGRCAATLRGRHALLASDLAAVRLTRYPPGLMSALQRMQDSPIPNLAPCVDHLQALPRKQPACFEGRVGLLAEI